MISLKFLLYSVHQGCVCQKEFKVSEGLKFEGTLKTWLAGGGAPQFPFFSMNEEAVLAKEF